MTNSCGIKMASQSTLSFVSDMEVDPTAALPDLPPYEINWQGFKWQRIEHSANQKKGSKVSPIWQFGDEYFAMIDPDRRAWRCQLCQRSIGLPGGRSGSALRHLQVVHPSVFERDDHSDIASVASLTTTATTATSDSRQLYPSSLIQRLDVPRFRHHLLRFIVNQQLPFTIVEDEHFRQLLLALSHNVEKYFVMKSTIRTWVQEDFDEATQVVRSVIAQAKSRIHISFDLWTSPNAYTLCAVCAHFIGNNYLNSSVLLALKRITGPHSGENIAEVIIPTLQSYEISPNLGVFVADNADSNDSAIRATLSTLRPDLDPRLRRSRCLGHIINLAAQAFLFGKDVTAFEEAVDVDEESVPLDSSRMKAAQEVWRRQGPVGKFHNVVVFIRSSSQRREAFKGIIVGESFNGKWCLLCSVAGGLIAK